MLSTKSTAETMPKSMVVAASVTAMFHRTAPLLPRALRKAVRPSVVPEAAQLIAAPLHNSIPITVTRLAIPTRLTSMLVPDVGWATKHMTRGSILIIRGSTAASQAASAPAMNGVSPAAARIASGSTTGTGV